MAIPRVHAATHDGSLNGPPVFLPRDEWERVKREQRSQVSAQFLQNPLAGEENTFLTKWLRPYWVRPIMMNVYILIDPSLGRSKSSDRTAVAVVDANGNKHLLDGYCHRMRFPNAGRESGTSKKKWTGVPGAQLVKVGLERYGMQSDRDYFEERMRLEGYSFTIEELNWTGERAGESKKVRVGRLEPASCGVCRRRLKDDTSIARGIGPCCFELVLDEVGRRLPAALPAQPVFAA